MTQSQRIAAEAEAALARLLARTDAHPDASLGDAYRGRRVADVLTHLHAWHALFEGWLEADRAGEPVAFPADGFTWRDLDALNDALHASLAHLDYAEARAALTASHGSMLALLATLEDAGLTDPDACAWTGGESLGTVAHECLTAHYAWGERVLDAAGVGPASAAAT